MTYRVLSFDPGGTTGWASYTAEVMHPCTDRHFADQPMPEYYDQAYTCGQLGPGDHHDTLWAFLELQAVSNLVIVCESFEFRNTIADKNRGNLELVSKEYIGVIKLFIQQRGKALPNHYKWKLVFQTASVGKPRDKPGNRTLVTDNDIKTLGLWYPKRRHAMDATGHLLYYMITQDKRQDILRRMHGK